MVSTPELAIIFRGESVSGHPGARGGPKSPNRRPEDFLIFWKMCGAMFDTFWASPGPGVAGNGFSAKSDSQFRGRHSNPCPGDPCRGHFSFLKVPPKKTAKTYVYVVFAPLSANNFRAQVVIDAANFAKTENGHETGPQGTDSGLDP